HYSLPTPMRFQTPQFIEIEDKIFGPLTLKQFIYLLGGAGLAFIFYRFLNIFVAVPLIIASLGFGIALAFYKINNRPFAYIIEVAAKYFLRNKLYIWKKKDKPVVQKTESSEEDLVSGLYVPKLSDSKLKDLAWSLDIKNVENPGTSETMRGK
ncbi:MAG: PrgI family protein, partial [Candidatus Paceibacterota bacterium]